MRLYDRVFAVLFVLFGGGGFPPGYAADAPAAPAAQVAPVDAAIAKTKDENPMVRRQACEELGRLRDPKAVDPLTPLLDDKSPLVRSAAVDALGTLRSGAPKIAELLVKDPDPQVRSQAAISLTYLADASTEDALIKALDDATQTVRFSAARTLGNLRSQKAVPKLIALLDAKQDVPTRQSAAAALERISSHDSLAALETATKDPDPGVRQQALRGLASIGDKAAVDAIRERLTDTEPVVKVQAAMALGRFGDAAGLPVGLELLASPDALLRQQGSQIVGLVGDREKGLKALDEAFAKELDPSTKQMIDLGRAQLKARLGIREAQAPAATPVVATTPTPAPSPKVKTGAVDTGKAASKTKKKSTGKKAITPKKP